jgi:3-hydroxyacyl-CoA dehydrogenase
MFHKKVIRARQCLAILLGEVSCMAITTSVRDGVALLKWDNPPVNAIASWLPGALMQALAAQMNDPTITAIILHGAGRCFSAGADIAGFDSPDTGEAGIRALMQALDSATKPVVAALHGYAFGGGLEIALAAQWRVAAPGTRLGLPEINLGLLPGAGGTQRLPRLVGVAKALDMMTSGKPIDAAAALAAGLVECVAAGDLLDDAVAFARSAHVRRVRDLTAAPDPASLEQARTAASARKLRAPALNAIIDCVEDATSLPFDEGIGREATRFAALLASDASHGLRHAFFAERAVARVPGLPAADATDIARAAVIGAGTMGSGITIALLEAGIAVTLIEQRPEALAAGAGRVRDTIQSLAKRGRISQPVADARIAALGVST